MRFNSTIRLLLTTALVLGTTHTAFAQLQGVTRLEGKILDEKGSPVSCKMFFVTPAGKKFDISSKPDGTYLQTFNEAGNIRILFKGHNVYFQESAVDIPKNPKFQSIEKNFSVRAMVEGTELASSRGFELNGSALTADGRNKIAEVIKMMSANPQMRTVISISPDTDQLLASKVHLDNEHQKAIAEWKKATKKVKKGQTAPPEPVRPADPADPNPALVQARIDVIKGMMKDVANGDERIAYHTSPLPAQPSSPVPAPVAAPVAQEKKKKGKGGKQPAATATPVAAVSAPAATNHPTLVVRVGQVKKLFN